MIPLSDILSEKSADKLWWFLVSVGFGVGIGIAWILGFGYVYVVFSALWLFGGTTPGYTALLYPSFSILPVALIFSFFRKHNIVSGILIVAIVFTIYGGVQTKKLADDSIARSGKSFYSALAEHFHRDSPSQ